MNWKPHDRAIFVSVLGDAQNPSLYGAECHLISLAGPIKHVTPPVWYVDFGHKKTNVAQRCLRPIPDDFTRFHKALVASKWSDCEWNPMVEIEQ